MAHPSEPVPSDRSAAELLRRVIVGFAVAVLILAIVGGVAYWSTSVAAVAVRQRRQSSDVLAALASVRSHLQDVETGQRGYQLTGEPLYLEPFATGSVGLEGALARLDTLLAGDTAQAPGLARLRPFVAGKLELSSRIVRLHDEGGSHAALELVRTDSGRLVMESARRVITAMDAIESERLSRSNARVRRSMRITRITVLTGGGLALLLVVGSGVRIRQDIKRRAAAEAALRESEGRLFRILEALPVAVFVVDGKGHPYYANALSTQLLGKGVRPRASVDELPEVYQAYVAGTDTPYPTERQPIVKALHGERAYGDDIEIHRPDRVIPIEVWAAPIHDGAGHLAYAIAAFQDITARRIAEERLRELNRELEAFSYSVSHDLRAPLRAIEGFTRILVEDHAAALDLEAQRLFAVVRQNTVRMGQLIDDLLAFSRTSRQELRWHPVDMDALVRAVLTDVKGDGGSTVVEVAPLPAARGDRGLLRQVWTNLVDNAVKYSRTRAQPRVEIGAKLGTGEPVYFVRDNGVGFDMTYAGKLFGVFQRLHRADEFEGTGVGLATVQRIVHRHGGRVWAESTPDAGATFFFTLGRGPENDGHG